MGQSTEETPLMSALNALLQRSACKERAKYARANTKEIAGYYREVAKAPRQRGSKKQTATKKSTTSTDVATGRRHLVIPDTQVKPDVELDHFTHIGHYIVKMKPQVIDPHWRPLGYAQPVELRQERQSPDGRQAGTRGHRVGQQGHGYSHGSDPSTRTRQRRNKEKLSGSLRCTSASGNHEQRIIKAVDADAQLETLMSFDDFNLEEHGWTVHPFLKPVMIDGICYAHYIVSGTMGRPVSSARIGLTKRHQSFVMGHVQQRDIAFANRADGSSITGVFLGICYQHDEGYLTPQTNTDQTWSGVWVLHDVRDGIFDVMPVSLNWLRRQYG